MKPHPSLPDDLIGAPHAPLTDYYASERERRGFLRGIFDRTAADYDRVESLLALGTGSWYRREALLRAGLQPRMSVVDIGTGTGSVARQAARLAGDPALVTGIDPSAGMMANARLPPGIVLVGGRAEQIPCADASFDFLSMGYALRHVSDLTAVFREFRRVLKPGGRLCLLEITRPKSAFAREMLKAYMRGAVPLLARAFARGAETAKIWRYYWDTIEACAPPDDVKRTLEAAGFTEVGHQCSLGVFSEYQATKPR